MTPDPALRAIADEIFLVFQTPRPSDPISESQNGIPSSRIMESLLLSLHRAYTLGQDSIKENKLEWAAKSIDEAFEKGFESGLERAIKEFMKIKPILIDRLPAKCECKPMWSHTCNAHYVANEVEGALDGIALEIRSISKADGEKGKLTIQHHSQCTIVNGPGSSCICSAGLEPGRTGE